jgi:hypothetical protein
MFTVKMSTDSATSDKAILEIGDSVMFTDLYRSTFKSNDFSTHTIAKIKSTRGKEDQIITFNNAKKAYSNDGCSGDDGYVPSYSSVWLVKINP